MKVEYDSKRNAVGWGKANEYGYDRISEPVNQLAATWCDEFSPGKRHVSSLRTMKPDVRITSLSYLMAVEGYVRIGKMAIELLPNLRARRLCCRKRHLLMLRAPVPSRSLFVPSDGYGGIKVSVQAIERRSAARPGVPPGVENRCQEFKILVVDDSPIYRKLVDQSLSKDHYLVLFAKNGREALAVFAEHRPALIITDWTMPDIGGPELCQRIRREFQDQYAYLILLTSNSTKEQIIEGLAAGADDYLTKPFHPGELVARVGVGRRVIELHRQIEAKNRQLEELALTDPLTGLPNRRAIDIWASRQFSAAARHDFPIWVVMADLDHFKRINDTFGHDAGDEVLKGFSGVLKANTRQSNMCGRLGGEEFLLILTHVDRKQAEIPVERIRQRFEMHEFSFEGKTAVVTASFGVAGFRGSAPSEFSSLLSRADAALYAAKGKGRNRVEFDDGVV